jgi:hypothetical protein
MGADTSIYINTAKAETWKDLYQVIRSMPSGVYAVDFAPARPRASAAQRGYYWAVVVVEVGLLTGLDRKQTDRLLCSLLLSSTVEVAGKPVQVVGTTSDLDCGGMADFLSNIRAWVLDAYGVELTQPDPNRRKG